MENIENQNNENTEKQDIPVEEVVQEKKQYYTKSKEYYAKYYADNKERILAMLREMVICPFCGSSSSHQNLKRHQKSNLCKRRMERKNKV